MRGASLYQIHQPKTQNAENNNEHQLQIVKVLDRIFKHTDIALNEKQIAQITEIITSPPHQMKNKLKPLTKLKRSVDDNENMINNGFYYCLNSDDSYLSSLCGSKFTETILNILEHKMYGILLFSSVIVHFIMCVTIYKSVIYSIYALCVCCWWIPQLCFSILCINRKAFQLIVVSFDFWIKVLYVISVAIAVICNEFIFHSNEWENAGFSIIPEIMLQIASILFVVVVASFDGLNVNVNLKITVSIIFTIIYIFFSLKCQFLVYSNGDDSVIHISDKIAFSLNSIIVNAFRILAIFIGKQGFLTIFNKNKAVSISIKPYLKWSNNDNKQTESQINSREEVTTEEFVSPQNTDEVKLSTVKIKKNDKTDTHSLSDL